MSASIALITGASSGIGREAALALAAQGTTVYAGARRPMPDLEKRGIHTLTLDVTDEASLQAAVDQVIAEAGRVDILVNNAGYGSYGAIEDTPLAEARRQFEVNVFGAIRLTQLVLPHMTTQGYGRIVNVSSLGGRFSMALGGWYHATKYALEALSDALRQEVRPFGVDVVLIEPGLIHTNWARIAAEHLKTTSGLGKYAAIATNFAAALQFAAEFATDPAVIGRAIARAALSKRPRTRYLQGPGSRAALVAATILPDRLVDYGLRLALQHMGDLLDLLHSDSKRTV